jgi:hypothetical protein
VYNGRRVSRQKADEVLFGEAEGTPLSDQRPQRQLSAILAADVAGYSRLIGLDEEGTLARLLSV